MKFVGVLAVVFAVTTSYAQMGTKGVSAFNAEGKGIECIVHANQAVADMSFGMDPDGVPFYFDVNGKVVINNRDRIVKQNSDAGTETITYKTKTNRGMCLTCTENGRDEEKTIVIKRDSNGRLTGLSKQFDLQKQFELAKETPDKPNHYIGWPMGMPFIKSAESEFAYDGDTCKVNQSYMVQVKDEKSKEELKVIFDKKLCESLAPMFKEMGRAGADACANLVGMAEAQFNVRSRELSKEGKSFQSWFGSGSSRVRGVTSLALAIQSCNMVSRSTEMGMGFPMGGIGYGMGMIGGLGGGMGFPGEPTAPKAEAPAKAKK